MRVLYIYKKWNIVILLNNLISSGFFVYTKKILFLQLDINKFSFWVYSKNIKAQTNKVFTIKRFFL